MGKQIGLVATFVIFALLSASCGPSERGVAGHWLRKSADGRLVEQITIRRNGNTVTMRYFEGGGLMTLSFSCDGTEHKVKSPVSSGPELTLRAECDDDSLVLTRGMLNTRWTERWTALDGGSRLVVSDGIRETSYQRPSMLQRLMVGTP